MPTVLGTAAGVVHPDARELRRTWGWFLALGTALVVLGSLALGAASVVTLASVIFFGWLLVIGGVLQVVHAFWTHRWGGFLRQLVGGLLALVVGGLLVANPVQGALSVTLLLAAFFTAGGLLRIVVALSRQFPGRGWVLMSGVVTLALGIMIWAQWPVSGMWVIGTFVGIDLIFDGWSLVMLSLAARRLPA